MPVTDVPIPHRHIRDATHRPSPYVMLHTEPGSAYVEIRSIGPHNLPIRVTQVNTETVTFSVPASLHPDFIHRDDANVQLYERIVKLLSAQDGAIRPESNIRHIVEKAGLATPSAQEITFSVPADSAKLALQRLSYPFNASEPVIHASLTRQAETIVETMHRMFTTAQGLHPRMPVASKAQPSVAADAPAPRRTSVAPDSPPARHPDASFVMKGPDSIYVEVKPTDRAYPPFQLSHDMATGAAVLHFHGATPANIQQYHAHVAARLEAANVPIAATNYGDAIAHANRHPELSSASTITLTLGAPAKDALAALSAPDGQAVKPLIAPEVAKAAEAEFGRVVDISRKVQKATQRMAPEQPYIPAPVQPSAQPPAPTPQPTQLSPPQPAQPVHEHTSPSPPPAQPSSPVVAETAAPQARQVAHQGMRGVGASFGVHGLAQKLGSHGAFTHDKAAGGVRSVLAHSSVVADGAVMASDAAHLAAALAKTTALTSQAAGALAGAAEAFGRRNVIIATGAGALEVGTALSARDGHRAAAAIGGTVGGLAVGTAAGIAGAKVGAAIGTAILTPGVGTFVGAVVGGAIGFAGGYFGAQGGAKLAANSPAGDALHSWLNSPNPQALEKSLAEAVKQLEKPELGWQNHFTLDKDGHIPIAEVKQLIAKSGMNLAQLAKHDHHISGRDLTDALNLALKAPATPTVTVAGQPPGQTRS